MTRLAIVIVSLQRTRRPARASASLDRAAVHVARDRRRRQRLDRRRAALVRERFPAVRVIDAGGNLGFARANNIGIRATTSEFVLLLNPRHDRAAGRDRRDSWRASATRRTSPRSGRGWSTARAARSCRSARCTAPGRRRGARSRSRSTHAASAPMRRWIDARHGRSATSTG